MTEKSTVNKQVKQAMKKQKEQAVKKAENIAKKEDKTEQDEIDRGLAASSARYAGLGAMPTKQQKTNPMFKGSNAFTPLNKGGLVNKRKKKT